MGLVTFEIENIENNMYESSADSESVANDFCSKNNAKIFKHGNVTNFEIKSKFKTIQQSQKQNRLKHLLDQASVYSKFLSSKFIKNQNQETDNEVGDKNSANFQQASKTYISQPSLITGGTLKSYQLEGLEWLISLYENGLNGILADEMGLGKTLQCISFMAFLREKGVYGPFLIAAPLSTLANWDSEIKKFAPDLPCLLYHGSKIERAAMRQKHFGIGTKNRKATNLETFPIIISSYEIIMNDKSYLDNFLWKFIIVDEGHRIKNLNCKLIKILKEFDSANRLLLTGTPLQNNLAELWSLLNFLLPDIFNDLEVFQRWFDASEIVEETETEILTENRVSIVSNLHNILRPFLLRRLKVDVEKDLPPKKEYIIYCNMSSLQKQYYNSALTRTLVPFIETQIRNNMNIIESGSLSKMPLNLKKRIRRARFNSNLKEVEDDEVNDEKFIQSLQKEADYTFEHNEDDSNFMTKAVANDEVSESVKNMKLQNLFMQLRKICNHPYTLFYPYDLKTEELKIDEKLVKSSGKLIILDQLLPALIIRKHRILIFSQMTGTMDILEDYLNMRNFRFCRIDGSTPQISRESEIAEFRKDDNIPVFLLSTRAAGLGINLVAADTVIFYDSDWNPQMDLQAQDRAHRIGQTKPVLVYRLASANSVEAKILERASSKRKLEKVVMHKSKFKGIKQLAKNYETNIQAEELKQILTEETTKSIGNKNHEEDLDSDQIFTKLSAKEISHLMDRSDKVFSKTTLELETKFVRVAKPVGSDLNDTLASM